MIAVSDHRCGHVAIVGRPNVGKSTLLNALLGQKLSITSRKPQTTRNPVTGIITREETQLILVDTPGFQTHFGSQLNRRMNQKITQSLAAVDVVLLMLEATKLKLEDRQLIKGLPVETPVVVAVNKIDRLSDRTALLPFIKKVAEGMSFSEIVPISAAKGQGLEDLIKAVAKYLPRQPALHAADEITEASERFLAAELIREKIFRLLGEELPYVSAVTIEDFVEEGGSRRIRASIIAGKESHKGMIIGAQGACLKKIASQARRDMEQLFGGKVFLEVWVKAKPGWTDDEHFLQRLDHG